jgi:hypothetical protein
MFHVKPGLFPCDPVPKRCTLRNMIHDREWVIGELRLYQSVVTTRNRIVRAASDAGFTPTEIEKYSGLSRTTIYRILGHGPTGEHT